jgi:uncharacterized protein YjiS (DUF1127 family)
MTRRIAFDSPDIRDAAFRGMPRAVSAGGLTARILTIIARWRQRRLLEQLDERTLRDIGISRSEALAEARKPCWRR